MLDSFKAHVCTWRAIQGAAGLGNTNGNWSMWGKCDNGHCGQMSLLVSPCVPNKHAHHIVLAATTHLFSPLAQCLQQIIVWWEKTLFPYMPLISLASATRDNRAIQMETKLTDCAHITENESGFDLSMGSTVQCSAVHLNHQLRKLDHILLSACMVPAGKVARA